MKFLENEEREKKEQAQRNYLDLLNTDNESIVTNNEPFDCPVCFTEIDPGDGIRLRGCLHMICKSVKQDIVSYFCIGIA